MKSGGGAGPDVLFSGPEDRPERGPVPARALTAAAVALALLAGGVLYVGRDTPEREPRAAATASPTPSPLDATSSYLPPPERSAVEQFLDSLPVGPPPSALLVVDNVVVDLSSGSDQPVPRTHPVDFARVTAVATRHGMFLQGDALDGGDRTRHWQLQSPEHEGAGSGNFGRIVLNADESRAAYTRHDHNGTFDRPDDDVVSVELLSFPQMRVLESRRLPWTRDTQAMGFVGQRVMLTRGDGADVSTHVWTPGGQIRAADRAWTSTAATEPAGSWAVVNQGDGPCGRLVKVGRTVPPPPAGDVLCLTSPAFSADGTLLASLDWTILADDVSGILRVRKLPGREIVSEMVVAGPPGAQGELTVRNAEEVLLLVPDLRGPEQVRYAVVRCHPAQARCELAWRSDVERGFGHVSIVRG